MKKTHSTAVAYILWIFGFTGVHRFYVGKQLTGTLWFFTGGLAGIGWILDIFFIPGMVENAELKFEPGEKSFTTSWILLLLLGLFGVHRFYLGKVWSGIAYLCTGGILGIGFLYDLWTLNNQVEDANFAVERIQT